LYINVYKLKEMPKEDYNRIMKRSETETDSILEDVGKIIDKVKEQGDDALVKAMMH
jgi:histidinol dehydrogenase